MQNNDCKRKDRKERMGGGAKIFWKIFFFFILEDFNLPTVHIKLIGVNHISKIESNLLSKKRKRRKRHPELIIFSLESRLSFHRNLPVLGLFIQYQKQKLCLIKTCYGDFKLKIGVFKHVRYNKLQLQFMLTHSRRPNESSPAAAAAAAAESLQSCLTLRDPIDCSPTRLPRPWDSPGKNTGVGCHFLLQCMKVKSQSEVAQSCLSLSDPMDCSPPGSSVHGIFQARVLEWGAIAFSGEP